MAYSSQHNDYVNPADLFSYGSYNPTDAAIKTELDLFDTTLAAGNIDEWTNPNDLTHSHQDSAVDLRGFYTSGPGNFPRLKTEDSSEYENFLTTPYSTPASNASNTPSPHGDMVFSTSNSPGDYNRDQSQTSSPEANTDLFTRDSILIPQSIEPPNVNIMFDKTKTRAETQIKTVLVLDPLPRQYQFARFPRHTLSKSTLLSV
jgi:hypothetical protein